MPKIRITLLTAGTQYDLGLVDVEDIDVVRHHHLDAEIHLTPEGSAALKQRIGQTFLVRCGSTSMGMMRLESVKTTHPISNAPVAVQFPVLIELRKQPADAPTVPLEQMATYQWSGDDRVDAMAHAIQALAPQERPIAVGDYVRWEYGPQPGRPGGVWTENFVEGEVTEIGAYTSIRVDRCGLGHRRGATIDFGTDGGPPIRRIPRPDLVLDGNGDVAPAVSGIAKPGEVMTITNANLKEPLIIGRKYPTCSSGAHLVYGRPDDCHCGKPYRVEFVDPLDVEYDGVKLRELVRTEQIYQRGESKQDLTPAQRAAVSAHWSAELRAKVAASAAADKARETSVVVDLEDW